MNEARPASTLLELIDIVDNVPYDFDYTTLYKLLLPNDARAHGFLLPETVAQLPWTSDFLISSDSRTVQVLDASAGADTSGAVNAAFQAVVDAVLDRGLFHAMLHGDHSEPYRIMGANFPAQMERFPAPLFGIGSRGAHMTAFVRGSGAGGETGEAGDMKIWVARRGKHLFTYPDMLDTTVAGGVKAADGPLECVVGEADEEASLPAALARSRARAAGAVTYVTRSSRRSGLLSPTVLYVFDLELPAGVRPAPKDGEVAEFLLLGVEEVRAAMLRGEFKPNCNLVMIDFFIRHGIVTDANEPDFLDLCTRLRRPLPIPTAPER